MKFWDSSAIVPLFVRENHSADVSQLLKLDSSMFVWWGTRTECVSALMRRMRESGTTIEEVDNSRLVLASLALSWTELEPSGEIRNMAELLLEAHPLKAADAFQLAAALKWREGVEADGEFVSLDRRLRDAAFAEGLMVVPTDL